MRKYNQDMTGLEKLAGEEGFEPSLPDPESGVLPLDDSPATGVTESKSRPLPGLLNTVGPLKKAAEIGQKIQSLLPNPLKITLPSYLRDINTPLATLLASPDSIPLGGDTDED